MHGVRGTLLCTNDKHQVCRFFAKFGECREVDCPFKHSETDIKDCNMYNLGFCIHGSQCRYRHIKKPGPPPTPEEMADQLRRGVVNKNKDSTVPGFSNMGSYNSYGHASGRGRGRGRGGYGGRGYGSYQGDQQQQVPIPATEFGRAQFQDYCPPATDAPQPPAQ